MIVSYCPLFFVMKVETLMYGGEDEANYTNQPDSPKSTISRKSRLTQASGGDSIEEIPDPLIDRVKYLEHLSALQKKALQVRIEEERLEKVKYLLNKEIFTSHNREIGSITAIS